MKKWLESKGVTYEPTYLIVDLLEKIHQQHSTPVYLTDKAAHEIGHAVCCASQLPIASSIQLSYKCCFDLSLQDEVSRLP